jgi:hypothetical protein
VRIQTLILSSNGSSTKIHILEIFWVPTGILKITGESLHFYFGHADRHIYYLLALGVTVE